jgi:tetratricopeptide (TPR) repeat protein
MKKYLVLLIILFPFIRPAVANNQKSMHDMAMKGIDFASSLQFKKAVEIFDRMIELEPDNPQPYFLKSATFFWMYSSDMHNEQLGEEFKNHSYKAVEIAETRLEKNENDIDALFYLGGAYGSLGRYYGIQKSYLNAYWYGKKGMNILEDVVELDSTYYDAYLGLGIYHYLADVLPRFVKILSFLLGIDGDRERGINELNIAARKGIYTRSEALFFLGAIYTYREHEYDKALEIWNSLLEKYPGNPGVLIHMGATYSRMGECQRALDIYNEVLVKLKDEMLTPISSIHYQMGNVYFKMNEFDKAISAFLQSIETDSLYSGNRRWTYSWSNYWLGQAYEMKKDTLNAKKYYQMIEEDDNDRPFRRARERLENPLSQIDIDLTIAQNNIDCSQYEEAMQRLDKLLSAKNGLSRGRIKEIEYNKGQIMFYRDQINSAIQQFNILLAEEWIKDEWYWGWGHYYRGCAYLKLGMTEKARDDFEIALETDSRSLEDRIKKELMLLDE